MKSTTYKLLRVDSTFYGLILLSFILSPLAHSQRVFQIDSSRASGVECYFGNNGMYFNKSTENRQGLRYPRSGGQGYALGAGFWIGCQTEVHGEVRPFVLKSFDPAPAWSMCVPGEYINGNLYREDLKDKYAVNRTVNSSTEVFTSSFHDGDLRYFRYMADTVALSASGLPMGFQISQRMTSYLSGQLENCVVVETTVRYVGERDLDSVVFAYVLDAAIGPATDNLTADADDSCRIVSGNSKHPIVVTESKPLLNQAFGALGAGLLSVSTDGPTFGIQISRRVLIDDLHERIEQYQFLTQGSQVDTMQPDDRVFLISTRIGRLVKNDSFSVTIGYVTASPGIDSLDSYIGSQLGRLKDISTGVSEIQSELYTETTARSVVLGNDLILDESMQYAEFVNATSILGETSRLPVNMGVVRTNGLSPGLYLVTDIHSRANILVLVLDSGMQ